MNIKNLKSLFVGAALLVLIAACGGSSGGSGGGASPPPPSPPPPPPPVGGIGRLGIAAGPVTSFGSIVVNGVHYDTSDTSFSDDGNDSLESELEVGQMVVVHGSIDDDLKNGTADTVTFDDNVTGLVDSIDLALSQIVVMGQTVLLRPTTSFDDNISPASIDGLTAGDIVEVSGFYTANGDIEATRIEGKPPATQFEVHGTVSNLDIGSSSFSTQGLVVDYSTATLSDFPNGEISDGDFVEAKGTSFGASGELLASKVELEGLDLSGDEGTHIEIEGFITRFVSKTDFDVSGVPVTTNGGTVYEGGVAADLGLNVKVEAEGDLDAANLLVADKIDIRRGKAVRATAAVDSVDAASGSLVMLGFTVSTDALTRFEDKSNAKLKPLTIGDINAGDYLEVRGGEFPAGSGQMLATILERDDPDSKTIMQGFVTAVADPTLTVMGVTIETAGAVFRDTDGSSLTRSEFFNMVDVDSLIKASGTETSATTITASELEFESEL